MPFITVNKVDLVKPDYFSPVAKNYYQTKDYLAYLQKTRKGFLIEIPTDTEFRKFALVKKKSTVFGFDVLWCPGGIIESATVTNSQEKTYLKRRSILIVGSFKTSRSKPVARLIGAEKTILVDVANFKHKLKMSKNWRKNQRRAHQQNTIVRTANFADLAEIQVQLKALEKFKQIDLGIDLEFIKFVLSCPDCISLIAEDQNCNFLGFRAAYFSQCTTFDLIAINSLEGKRCYASYLLVTKILDLAYDRGLTYFDFGGIDKINNLPVFNFKNGAGGKEVYYQSEYIINVHTFITWLLRKLMKK